MNNQYIEIALLLIFLTAQFLVFIRNRQKISEYENIFPKQPSYRLIHIPLTRELLEAAEEDDFFAEDFEFNDQDADPDDAPVSLLVSRDTSPVLKEILAATNRYLLHNRLAAADFHLLKDIAERNIDAVDDDISQTISVPLYLGLMSTMLGIIFGLYAMPNLNIDPAADGKDLLLNEGITTLIGGVKIAMIASLAGLGLTIASSGYLFKGSRKRVERRKNAYYSFLQTSLLPIMNQSIGATLSSLQFNLLKFNEEFSGNLRGLSSLFRSNQDALQLQQNLLDEITNLDMGKLARFNVEMFREVTASVQEFKRFNIGMAHLNDFVETSKTLSDRVTDLMKRSDNFEKIAHNIEEKLEISGTLLGFLGEHFQTLKEHKDLVLTAVGDVSLNITDLFRDLQSHFKSSAETLRLFTIEEIETLKNALANSRNSLSNLEFLKKLDELDKLSGLQELNGLRALDDLGKLSELNKLSALTEIKEGVDLFNSNASFQSQTTILVQELNANIGTAVKLLEEMQDSWADTQNQTLGSRIRKIFGSK